MVHLSAECFRGMPVLLKSRGQNFLITESDRYSAPKNTSQLGNRSKEQFPKEPIYLRCHSHYFQVLCGPLAYALYVVSVIFGRAQPLGLGSSSICHACSLSETAQLVANFLSSRWVL